MDEKISFIQALKNMMVGFVKPAAYIENGRKASWAATNIMIIIVSLILPVCIFFIPVNKKLGNDYIADKVDEKISDFSISQNGFYSEKQYEWSGNGSFILIDTSRSSTSQDEIDEYLETGNYNTMIIANSQEIVMYSDNTSNVFKWDSIYKYLNSIEPRDTYNKDMALSLVRKYDTPVIWGITFAMAIAILLGYYICSFFWGVFGTIMASMLNKKISISEMMKSAVYIRTPWYIIRKIAGIFLITRLSRTLWTLAFIIIFIYEFIAINKMERKETFKTKIARGQNDNETISDAQEEYYGD